MWIYFRYLGLEGRLHIKEKLSLYVYGSVVDIYDQSIRRRLSKGKRVYDYIPQSLKVVFAITQKLFPATTDTKHLANRISNTETISI